MEFAYQFEGSHARHLFLLYDKQKYRIMSRYTFWISTSLCAWWIASQSH